jgi:hypothetical protein
LKKGRKKSLKTFKLLGPPPFIVSHHRLLFVVPHSLSVSIHHPPFVIHRRSPESPLIIVVFIRYPQITHCEQGPAAVGSNRSRYGVSALAALSMAATSLSHSYNLSKKKKTLVLVVKKEEKNIIYQMYMTWHHCQVPAGGAPVVFDVDMAQEMVGRMCCMVVVVGRRERWCPLRVLNGALHMTWQR